MKPSLAKATLLLLVSLVGALFVQEKVALGAGDDALAATVKQIMAEDYPGNLGAARKKLQDALAQCLKKTCSGATKAQIYMSLGMVASQVGAGEEAKTDFKNALTADASAKLPQAGTTPSIRSQFDEAKAAVAPPPPPAPTATAKTPPPPPPPPAPTATGKTTAPPVPTPPVPTPGPSPPAPAGGTDEPPADAPAAPAGKPPAGWQSAEAFRLVYEGLEAGKKGDYTTCIEKDKKSLKLEEQVRSRLHLAACEAKLGKLVDALNDSTKAAELARQKNDRDALQAAEQRINELMQRIPRVTFQAPTDVTELEVTFDKTKNVPIDKLTKQFPTDPGKHTVRATAKVNNIPNEYEQEFDVKERELATVHINLTPVRIRDDKYPSTIRDCIVASQTKEEFDQCLDKGGSALVVRVGTDFSGYSDTNHVNVFSPAINGSVTSPTSGWNIGGNYILDVVSAASPDIVSTASPPFKESRHAGGLNGGYKIGRYGLSANANVSREPDYLSLTAGGAISMDLNDKLITPRLGYSFSHDTVGRGPSNPLGDITPLKGTLNTQEVQLGVTFVLSPSSIILVGGTAAFERGDQSKPYRYVPMFSPDTATRVPVGATVDLVNRVRDPIRPTEQLPTARDRYAFGGRMNKRIGKDATFRIDERFYLDTWGTKASSTDIRYMVDLSQTLRVWPHVRLHAQSAANFYQRAYPVIRDEGSYVLPTYRSGDRELAPLVTVTAGGGSRIELAPEKGETRYGINFSGDVMYTRFFNTLFVTTRTGVYGTVGFDVEF